MVDVVVVGGGVAGLFTAYHLSTRGYSVTVVDDARGGTTRASGGLVTPSFALVSRLSLSTILRGLIGIGPFKVSMLWALRNPRWVRGALTRPIPVEAVRALAEASLKDYLELLAGEFQGVYWRKGILGLFKDPSEASSFASISGGRMVSEGELVRSGIRGLTGVLLDEVFVDPESLLESLSQKLAELGVSLEHSKALKVYAEGENAGVYLHNGARIVSERVVVAAGSQSSELLRGLGYSIPLTPARGLALIARTRGRLDIPPALLEDYGIVVAPLPGNKCRITGFFELVGYKSGWSTRRKNWLISVVKRHIQGLLSGDPIIERELTGYRPCTPDQAPVVGALPGTERVLVNMGHCRLGITLAPATARLVADIIEGRERKEWDKTLEYISPSRLL